MNTTARDTRRDTRESIKETLSARKGKIPTPVWTPFPGAQQRFLSCPVWEVLLHGNRGGGKSMPLWSKVLTPDGWVSMGDLLIGSFVIDPITNSEIKILDIFPQGDVDVYKITTSGGVAFSSLDHLWMIQVLTSGNVMDFPDSLDSLNFPYILKRTSDILDFLGKGIPVYIPKYNSTDADTISLFPQKVLRIEKYKKDFCQCIKVDSPDGLYITDDFIVTHNTDVLLMDFLQDVGKGYGSDYKGLLLREATTELGDIITKSKKWISQIFPGAKFNSQRKIWTFPDGESLWLNYARLEEDYGQYHGHEYSLYNQALIQLPNNITTQAKNIKVGDFLQTLQGPKKVTKVFHYKKPAVKLSVYDADSNLIGSQLQGVLHPVLTNAGWQRLGLFHLCQISEQSVIGKYLVKEVYKFLHGVHQEILHVSFLTEYNPLDSTISKLFSVQYSCLYQIFSQFLYMINRSPLRKAFHPYGHLKNHLCSSLNETNGEISELEWLYEHRNMLQLALYCQSLIFLLQKIHLRHVHLLQSTLCCYYGVSYKQYYSLHLGLKQSSFLLKKYPEIAFLHLQLKQDQIVRNDTNACVQSLIHKELNFQDHCYYDYSRDDGMIHQVLGIDQSFFQEKNDVQGQFSRTWKQKDAQGTLYGHTHSYPSLVSYTHPYTHVSCETKVPLDQFSFSVESPSFNSPIDMVDFEVEGENHYFSKLFREHHDTKNNQNKQDLLLINQNCWVGFEEITNQVIPNIYLKLMSCNRTSNKNIRKKYRATCNPSGPGHCVPFGEVLTPTGWVDIKKVNPGDVVFSVDEKGFMIEKKVQQIHKSYYEGEMINIEKRGLSITCTPNHKLPKLNGIVGDKERLFTLLEFKNLPGDSHILRSCEFEGVMPEGCFIVPDYNLKKLRKSRSIQPKTCSWENLAVLMGWFLSEGGTQAHQNSFSIAKSKVSYPEYWQEIHNLLINIGFKFSINKCDFVVYGRDWFQFFAQFGSYEDKFIPKEFKNWPPYLLQKMFTSMVNGDGHWYTKNWSGEYDTTSKQLAHDFCEIALKLGYIVGLREYFNEGHRDKYTIRFKRTINKHSCIKTGNHRYNVNTETKKIDTRKIDFKGDIYCLGVPDTHTFIIKQKGSVWISGNSWIKERFIDAGPPEKVIYDEFGQTRTHIQSKLDENKALLDADPFYREKLLAMTQDNKMLRDAWVHGSWDLITGGFFTDVWDKKIHVRAPFDLPRTWKILRSFDWGSSKPWAVTYGVEANGDQPDDPSAPYIPRGSVIIIKEIYGWNGQVNQGDQATSQEIAERVLTIDSILEKEYKMRVIPGPADTAIWEVRDGTSIANNLATHKCRWTRAYKGSGSRIAGWALIRQMLGAAKRKDFETPHLYFFANEAQHHVRTLPLMQRDLKKPEDLDSSGEDHLADSLRYLLTRKMTNMQRKKVGF